MKKWLVIFIFIMFLFPELDGEAKVKNEKEHVTIVIKTKQDSQYKSTIMITSKHFLAHLNKKVLKKNLKSKPISDAYLYHTQNGIKKGYLIDDKINIFEIHTNHSYELPKEARLKIKNEVKRLRKNHYGKRLPWNDATQLIPKYTKFEIIDIDTGLMFNVQRRAGSHHADVQPLTNKDTKIMKKIYQGKWSWKRRAILIKYNNKLMAASMHGMPHGQGALKNGFPGHFCIHFYLSKTHTRNEIDFSHNMMTQKAAGKIGEFYREISPYDLIDSFILSIHQNDLHLLKLTTTTKQYVYAEKVFKQLNDVKTMKRISLYQKIAKLEHNLFLVVPTEVQIVRDYQYEEKVINFLVYRSSFYDSWKVDMKSILDQLY